MRFDAAIARHWAASNGKTEIKPLMPWPREEPEPASPEQVLAFLKSSVKKKD